MLRQRDEVDGQQGNLRSPTANPRILPRQLLSCGVVPYIKASFRDHRSPANEPVARCDDTLNGKGRTKANLTHVKKTFSFTIAVGWLDETVLLNLGCPVVLLGPGRIRGVAAYAPAVLGCCQLCLLRIGGAFSFRGSPTTVKLSNWAGCASAV
ncbi:uncharacterized protein K489DRAFT_426322, partial [Dissoconium aciculare CBS 342.82]|uniref:Uncharacterized protein n=1 Tax=Dissoconium aciculare CBS 342.82 TaxID=1314786 RepID=A0A6J3M239_9PEZI